MKKEIQERIDRRKRQIAIHAYLYYELDDPIVDDSTFDSWCKELVDLIDKNGNTELWPNITWDASTAFHVCSQIDRVYLHDKATYIYRIHKQYTSNP